MFTERGFIKQTKENKVPDGNFFPKTAFLVNDFVLNGFSSSKAGFRMINKTY